MGWTYFQTDRAGLVRELSDINSGRVLSSKWAGWNKLWMLVEQTFIGPDETGETCSHVRRFIVLNLVQSIPAHGEWGYKTVEESSGPVEVDAPLSWLSQVTAPHNEWSKEWRQRVRDYHRKRGTGVQIKPGMLVSYRGNPVVVANARPLTVHMDGYVYRVKRSAISPL